MSWLVERDVENGREELNFSEWQRILEKEAEKAAKAREEEAGEKKEHREKTPELLEVVLEGRMPPWFYPPLHPNARLSEAERRELAQGLARTFNIPYAPGEPDEPSD